MAGAGIFGLWHLREKKRAERDAYLASLGPQGELMRLANESLDDGPLGLGLIPKIRAATKSPAQRLAGNMAQMGQMEYVAMQAQQAGVPLAEHVTAMEQRRQPRFIDAGSGRPVEEHPVLFPDSKPRQGSVGGWPRPDYDEAARQPPTALRQVGPARAMQPPRPPAPAPEESYVQAVERKRKLQSAEAAAKNYVHDEPFCP